MQTDLCHLLFTNNTTTGQWQENVIKRSFYSTAMGNFPNPALPSSTVVFFSFFEIFFFLYCTVCTVNYSNRFVPFTVHKQQKDWPMARKCDQKIHLQYSNGQFPKSSLAFLYRSLFLKYFPYCTVQYVL